MDSGECHSKRAFVSHDRSIVGLDECGARVGVDDDVSHNGSIVGLDECGARVGVDDDRLKCPQDPGKEISDGLECQEERSNDRAERFHSLFHHHEEWLV